MAEEWWYQTFGEEFGPVTLDTIRELHAAGTLDVGDVVRQGTHGPWKSLKSVLQRTPPSPEASETQQEAAIQDDPSADAWTSLDDLNLEPAEAPADSPVSGRSQEQDPSPPDDPPQAESIEDAWAALDEVPVSDTLSASAAGNSSRATSADPEPPAAAQKPAVSSAPTTPAEPAVPAADAPSEPPGEPAATEEPAKPSEPPVVTQPPSELSSAIRQATQASVRKEQSRLGHGATKQSAARRLPQISGPRSSCLDTGGPHKRCTPSCGRSTRSLTSSGTRPLTNRSGKSSAGESRFRQTESWADSCPPLIPTIRCDGNCCGPPAISCRTC